MDCLLDLGNTSTMAWASTPYFEWFNFVHKNKQMNYG